MGRKLFALLVAASFIYLSSPLLFPVAMGSVLAVLFISWLEWLERHRVPTKWGAAILTSGITLILLIPTSILIFLGTKTAFLQLQGLRVTSAASISGSGTGEIGGGFEEAVLGAPWARHLLELITRWLPIQMNDLTDAAGELIRTSALRIADFLGGVLTHLPGMAMALAVIVVSVYFFLVDGRRLVFFMRRNSIFTPAQTEKLAQTLAGMCRSVILASVVSGLAQAAFESIVGLIVGLPNVALLGMAVLVGSFIPVVGAAPITFGIAIFHLLSQQTTPGVTLLAAAVIVSALDNTIRPWFLKGAANLHPLLAFVAAFGGLQTLGFLGIFLGPILAAVFVVSVQFVMQPEEQNR